ncbi:MAG: hypothetical protein IT186_12675 [Acidobacteria bacterium]|nr:hypothetical protein [Acidobacteriota bacterium]
MRLLVGLPEIAAEIGKDGRWLARRIKDKRWMLRDVVKQGPRGRWCCTDLAIRQWAGRIARGGH